MLSIIFKALWIPFAARYQDKSRKILRDVQNSSEILDSDVVTIIVHVLGIKFWQKTVEKQKVNDIKHCKVIINYLQGFISDLNKNFIINGYSGWDCFVFSKN